MQVKDTDISEIKPYERNPRNNDEAVEYVANSIKEFGFQQPIVVDKDGIIIVGHTRFKAAKKLGLKRVPVVVAEGLTDQQVDAYRLADNKTGEAAEWNKDLLNGELDHLFDFDMEQFGFTDLLEEEEEEKEVPAEIPFTEVLGEESNYIVLKFSDNVDWLQLESIFELPRVQAYSTRTDGKISSNMVQSGIGRVVDGAEFLNRIGMEL